MQKEWYEFSEVLVSGTENVSGHLVWLCLAAMNEVAEKDAVHQLVFNPDLPKDMWGCFYGAVRAIGINLDQHFEFARDAVMHRSSHTSIKLVLLHDLIDTVMHEAWHAQKCLDGGDFSNSDLDEEGAIKVGLDKAWSIGRNLDVEIKSFGPLLDGMLEEFHQQLREDCEEPDAKEWKRCQLYMLDNNKAYYNPEGGTINTFREAMAVEADPDTPWPSKVTEYTGSDTVKPPVEETPAMEQSSVAPVAVDPAYNPLDDIGVETMNPFAEEELSIPANPHPVDTGAVIQQPVVAPVMQVPVATSTEGPSALDYQRAAEMVMRRLFHHVYTKCGAQPNGTFTTPEAVMEPVNIADIPYANQLFTAQDALDAYGNYKPKAPVEGAIRGLVSRQGLPRYALYLNVGGMLLKRTFIPQNPAKQKADGTYTAWAQRVQKGDRIMMLLGDAGPTADIQLPAGAPLGQETYKLWANK